MYEEKKQINLKVTETVVPQVVIASNVKIIILPLIEQITCQKRRPEGHWINK